MIIDSPIVSGSYAASGSFNQSGDVVISGSLTVTGSIIGTSSFATTASYALTASVALNVPETASYALNANSASFATTASYVTLAQTASFVTLAQTASFVTTAQTASFVQNAQSASYVLNAVSSSFASTASYIATASFALTASYADNAGAGAGFPFSGSAVITGSLLITNLSGSGVRYVVTDTNGLMTAQTASAVIKTTQAYTATADQTTFTVTNGYSTGYVDVFVNGTKLNSTEFTDTSGTDVVLATGSFANDVVEVVKYLPASGVSNNVLRTLTSFTATAGQTVFNVNYTPGLLDIFYNGSHLNTNEFTANNGTSFTLATASVANDILDVFVYSYQVGAFSGIGGQGIANQVAFYSTTSSISGSNNFTFDGSTLRLTGSFIQSGSSTFTNIGPTILSGSVSVSGSLTVAGGITISGSIASASYASNAELLDNFDSTSFVFTSSFNTYSSSMSTRTTNLESTGSSLITASSSFSTRVSNTESTGSSLTTASSSFSTRVTNLESTGSSLTTASGSFSTRISSIEGNYATTGSNVFMGAQTVCANITSTGTIVAQTLNVQQVTSSIVYSSGSNIFGCSLSNTQQFTGSVTMTGSLNVAGNTCVTSICSPAHVGGTISGTTIYGSTAICGAVICGGATTLTGALSGTSATFSGDLTIDTNTLYVDSTNNRVGIGSTSPSYKLDVSGSGNFINIIGASSGDVATGFRIGRGASLGAEIYDNPQDNITTFNTTGGLNLRVGGSNRLTIASTGAATFSSSVTANSLNVNTSTVFVKANIADALTATSIGTNYNPGILNIQNSSATNGNLSLIGFQDASAFINLAAIGAINTTHSGSPNSVVGELAFYTKASGESYIAERMRITSGGIACFACTVCAYSFASPTPSLTRNNLNITRATRVINSFNATASGARWLRVGCFAARTTYLMNFNTTGNYYTPGSTTFLMFRDWGNGFFTSTLGKLGEQQYVFCARMQSDNVGSEYALEVWMNAVSADQLNGVLVYSAASLAGDPDSILMCLGSYGTSLANAANTSTAIAL